MGDGNELTLEGPYGSLVCTLTPRLGLGWVRGATGAFGGRRPGDDVAVFGKNEPPRCAGTCMLSVPLSSFCKKKKKKVGVLLKDIFNFTTDTPLPPRTKETDIERERKNYRKSTKKEKGPTNLTGQQTN